MPKNKKPDVWIYESPNGGKTITRRRSGEKEKETIWQIDTDLSDPSIKEKLGIDIIQRIKYIIGKQK